MRYDIEIPKLLVLVQKRLGSHFLQDSNKWVALTGTTFLHHLRDGGRADKVSQLFGMKTRNR